MIFVPIGIDCGIADYLRNNNLRNFALPFDWCVIYNGITDIVKNNFSNFLPNDNSNISKLSYTSFIHNTFPNDLDKMNQRIKRFIDLLSTTEEEIIFFRKGHSYHNHAEASKLNCNIKDDITDCEEFYTFLKDKYPNLKFNIIIALNCDKCYDSSKEYESTLNCISIYNIITKNTMLDIEKFNNIFISRHYKGT